MQVHDGAQRGWTDSGKIPAISNTLRVAPQLSSDQFSDWVISFHESRGLGA